MLRFLYILALILGCAVNPNISKNITENLEHFLIPVDSIIFQNPIADFFLTDNGNILLLDQGLQKIFILRNGNFTKIDTLILPQKLYFIKGLVADDFFIYLYSDNCLYRYDPVTQNNLNLIQPKDGIKIIDLSLTQQGEIFINDNLNNKIFQINSLGQITDFKITIKDRFVPSGIWYDKSTSHLLVINAAQHRIEVYSRIGNLDSIIPLSNQNYSRIAIDNKYIYLLSNQDLYRLKNNEINHITSGIINFHLSKNWLVTLSINRKLFFCPK
jgi:hypothetical protein